MQTRTMNRLIVVNLSGASGGRRPCRQRRWLTSSLVETGSLNRGRRRNDAPANELDCKIVRAPDQTPETQREIERDAMSTDGRPRLGDMPYWPRILSEEAAAYVGLSVNTFRARTALRQKCVTASTAGTKTDDPTPDAGRSCRACWRPEARASD